MVKQRKGIYACIAVMLAACISAPFIYAYNLAETYAAVETAQGPDLHYSNYDETISEAERTRQEYEDKAAEVKSEIEELTAEYDDMLSFIRTLDEKQEEIAELVLQLSETKALLEVEKAATEAELAEAEKEMDRQYEAMAARIKYLYENGETSYWDILANSSDLVDLLNIVEYVSEISEYDDNLFKEYKEAVTKVTECRDRLNAQLAAIEEINDIYNQYLEYVGDLREAKDQAMAECAEKLGVEQEVYARYLEEIENQSMTIDEAIRAKEEEDRLAALAAQEPEEPEAPPETTDGQPGTPPDTTAEKPENPVTPGNDEPADTNSDGWTWPLSGYSHISSPFGPRKSPGAGASSNHRGIDIPAPFATPIVAAEDGIVITSHQSSLGNYVTIDHGNGLQTMYAHCSSFAVSSGTYVQKGQVIAYVGDTGVAYGYHLHFAVKVNGEYKNPQNYVTY